MQSETILSNIGDSEMNYETALKLCKENGQEQLLRFWNELSEDETSAPITVL